MADTYYVEIGRIEEQVVPGKRLGRHIRHDSRNRAYPHRRSGRELTSQLHIRHILILDQGNVGSCTGNEQVGALATSPLWDALPAAVQASLDEALALKIYSEAETIDGDGPYPPQDNGSTGPSAAQAAKNDGLISGYTHCFSLTDVLDALETGPVGIGSNWYDSMDQPDSAGLVAVSPGAQIRGGHEYVCRGKDIDKQLLFFDNSWGVSWGNLGSFCYSYATLERLLAEQGDATVPLPLTVTPPPPVPVPPDPALTLWAQTALPWTGMHHTGRGNREMAKASVQLLQAKGYA